LFSYSGQDFSSFFTSNFYQCWAVLTNKYSYIFPSSLLAPLRDIGRQQDPSTALDIVRFQRPPPSLCSNPSALLGRRETRYERVFFFFGILMGGRTALFSVNCHSESLKKVPPSPLHYGRGNGPALGALANSVVRDPLVPSYIQNSPEA
jgi:hypothetical protein